MGDFNLTRFLDERQGCEGNLNDIDSFNNLIWDLALIDISLGGRSFTWSNKRATSAFAKLDRCLVSEPWDDTFPLSTCKVLPNTLPDHIPISLHTFSSPHFTSRFHFESIWLEHRELHEIVVSAWSFISHPNVAICIAQKLCKMRGALKVWSRAKFESVKRQKLHLLDVLNKLDVLLELRPLKSDESSLQLSSLDDQRKFNILKKLYGDKGPAPFG